VQVNDGKRVHILLLNFTPLTEVKYMQAKYISTFMDCIVWKNGMDAFWTFKKIMAKFQLPTLYNHKIETNHMGTTK